jgi:hypothetical protein
MGKSVRVTGQLGSLGTLAPELAPDPAPAAKGKANSPLPPVVLFLPGMSTSPSNTSARLADVMCADLTRGSGTYAVRSLDGPGPALTDGRRIVAGDEQPLLDLYTVAYRDRLPAVAAADGKAGAWALARLALTQVRYFLRALLLLMDARKRAKTQMAKWQLVFGFGAVAALLGAVVLTLLAILVALGVLTLPRVPGTFADAFAIGVTGVTSWLLAKLTPTIRNASGRVQQMMDYADSQQQAVLVGNCLGEAIDAVLEPAGAARPVFILGYSMGALVAIDYLCPRESQLELDDNRYDEAIRGLITIGCPLDLIRLYLPEYTDGRKPRVEDLPWTNIFIPADVLGSNMSDDGDNAIPALEKTVGVAAMKPTRMVQFTDEKLTWSGIPANRGILSHGGYWSVPGAGNCLSEVLSTVRTA